VYLFCVPAICFFPGALLIFFLKHPPPFIFESFLWPLLVVVSLPLFRTPLHLTIRSPPPFFYSCVLALKPFSILPVGLLLGAPVPPEPKSCLGVRGRAPCPTPGLPSPPGVLGGPFSFFFPCENFFLIVWVDTLLGVLETPKGPPPGRLGLDPCLSKGGFLFLVFQVLFDPVRECCLKFSPGLDQTQAHYHFPLKYRNLFFHPHARRSVGLCVFWNEFLFPYFSRL